MVLDEPCERAIRSPEGPSPQFENGCFGGRGASPLVVFPSSPPRLWRRCGPSWASIWRSFWLKRWPLLSGELTLICRHSHLHVWSWVKRYPWEETGRGWWGTWRAGYTFSLPASPEITSLFSQYESLVSRFTLVREKIRFYWT